MNTILIKLVKVCLMVCLLVALSLWLAGCNHLDQAVNPTPKPTQITGVLNLVTDSNGVVEIPLSELGISHRASFTLNPSGFEYGEIILLTDSTLAYKRISLENWKSDDGVIQVCQGGACVTRDLIILNSDYDSIPGVLTCTFLGNVLDTQVVGLGQANLLNLPGLEPGAKIDLVWGMYHTARINDDSLGITYYAVGGPAQGYYLGFDQLYYRVTLPNGAGCKTASVRFAIPDNCTLPTAQPDIIQGSGDEITILHSQLYGNDLSCNGAVSPVNPLLRLRFQRPAIPVLTTKWGIIKDTLLNNTTPAFYYRRTVPGAHGDTLTYFMEDQADDRITVTNFTIRLN